MSKPLGVVRGWQRRVMHWSEFEHAQPRMARLGRERLIGPGVVLVATIRHDGTGVEVGGQQRAFRGGLQPDRDGDLDGTLVVHRPAVRPVTGDRLDLGGLRAALPLRRVPSAQADRQADRPSESLSIDSLPGFTPARCGGRKRSRRLLPACAGSPRCCYDRRGRLLITADFTSVIPSATASSRGVI